MPEGIQSQKSTKQKIIQWIMEHSGGRVTDEQQAMYVLLAIVVVAIMISFFIFMGQWGPSQNSGKMYYPPPLPAVQQPTQHPVTSPSVPGNIRYP